MTTTQTTETKKRAPKTRDSRTGFSISWEAPMDECERQCDHGTLEAEDHDGYATARFCDCAEGEALREADERDVPKWAVGR